VDLAIRSKRCLLREQIEGGMGWDGRWSLIRGRKEKL